MAISTKSLLIKIGKNVVHKSILIIFCLLIISCENEKEMVYREYKNVNDIAADKRTKLTSIEDGAFFYPQFNYDDSKVLFTSKDNSGLWYYDLNSKIITQLNNSKGTGKGFAVSNNTNKVFFKLVSISTKQNLQNHSIAEQDIETKRIRILYTSHEKISTPKILNEGILAFFINKEIKFIELASGKDLLDYETEEIVTEIDGDKIIYYKNGEIKDFIAKENSPVTWVEVSPLNDILYFYVNGTGAGTFNLKSSKISYDGNYRFVKCSPVSNLIAYSFNQKNDITGPDIFITNNFGVYDYNVTSSSEMNEMHVSWSADGTQIVYNTFDGIILITKLSIDSEENI